MQVASSTTASDELRERLLRAAEKLGDEVGEEGLTLGQVAACAGLGTSILHRHFDGKEALLWEVRRRFEAEIDRALASAERGIVDLPARLHRICSAYVDVARRDRWRYRLALADYDRGAHALTAAVARSFVDAAAACLVEHNDPSGLALRIWHATHVLITTLLHSDRRLPDNEERRTIDRYVRMTLSFSGAETLDRL
jgi:AcrR family transcriptional regulator